MSADHFPSFLPKEKIPVATRANIRSDSTLALGVGHLLSPSLPFFESFSGFRFSHSTSVVLVTRLIKLLMQLVHTYVKSKRLLLCIIVVALNITSFKSIN